MTINNVILMGDSILDNNPYVAQGEDVTSILDLLLPSCTVEKRAVDGSKLECVADFQLGALPETPEEHTQVFLSVGGNNLLYLQYQGVMHTGTPDVYQALDQIKPHLDSYKDEYRHVLKALKQRHHHICALLIYDAVPTLDPALKLMIGLWNDAMSSVCRELNVDVIDLRLICDEESDYSPLSPIEPSASGGEKIAQALVQYLASTRLRVAV